MKKLLICFILIANVVIALAQERVLELNATRKEDNSVEISYQKYKPGSYTVVLKFSNLTNASVSNENAYTANNTNGTIVTLRPQNKNEPIGYSYSYQYIRGELKPKINPKFEYLLPYKTGTNMFVQEAYFANSKYFGSQQPEDWKCYFFITKKSDTVIAVRKGVVIDVEDKYVGYLENTEFTTQQNEITIEHEDGTVMVYKGFQLKTITVKVGDKVFPGTPLGKTAIDHSGKRYSVGLTLFYLHSIDFESVKNSSLKNYKSLNKMITPFYRVGENDAAIILENNKSYTAICDEKTITKEMSKREIKKYKSEENK